MHHVSIAAGLCVRVSRILVEYPHQRPHGSRGQDVETSPHQEVRYRLRRRLCFVSQRSCIDRVTVMIALLILPAQTWCKSGQGFQGGLCH